MGLPILWILAARDMSYAFPVFVGKYLSLSLACRIHFTVNFFLLDRKHSILPFLH